MLAEPAGHPAVIAWQAYVQSQLQSQPVQSQPVQSQPVQSQPVQSQPVDGGYDIAYDIDVIVIDTNVLVAALRSTLGHSRKLLRRVLLDEVLAGVSVPLFLEYEAVLTRSKHLASFGLSMEEVMEFLDGLAARLVPIEVSYLWRPQLRDPADEMVLEAAVNGGASHLVTWNIRDFGPAAYFGLEVVTPAEFVASLSAEE